MPSRERIQELIAFAEQGKGVEAITEFYAEDAETQENGEPPVRGHKALLEKEQGMLAMVADIHEFRAVSFVVEGERVAINWLFEFTNKQGQRLRWDEIAYQTWQGDKIVSERFYYDTASLRV